MTNPTRKIMDPITVPSKPVTLCMLEDDDVDALLIVDAFRRAKLANPILRYVDGIEALEVLRSEDSPVKDGPLILLVDINMPRMNGFDFLREVRKDDTLKKLPAFVFTTSSQQEDKDLAYELNVAGYILKNRSGNDLLELVELLDSYWIVIGAL